MFLPLPAKIIDDGSLHELSVSPSKRVTVTRLYIPSYVAVSFEVVDMFIERPGIPSRPDQPFAMPKPSVGDIVAIGTHEKPNPIRVSLIPLKQNLDDNGIDHRESHAIPCSVFAESTTLAVFGSSYETELRPEDRIAIVVRKAPYQAGVRYFAGAWEVY